MDDGLSLLQSGTPAELLTAQFYAWEQRGRGWLTWPERVVLEPPFAPFEGHWLPRRGRMIDAARKPTLLMRLGSGVRRLVTEGAEISDEVELWVAEFLEVAPEPDEDEDKIVELRLAVPSDLKVAKEVVAQLLLGLPAGAGPVSFEVVGDGNRIVVQFAARERDAGALRQQIRAYFPEITVTQKTGSLAARWAGADGHSVVVDFGLSQEFMLPLRGTRGFDADPLSSVTAALGELSPSEVGVLQVLFQPTREPWAQSTVRAVLDNQGRPFLEDAPDLVRQSKEKLASPLFAALIRVGARGPDLDRSWELARALGGALRLLDSPAGNSLIPLAFDAYNPGCHARDLLDRRTHRSGMLLNLDELLTLVHPPSLSVRAERLVREERRTRAAPVVTGGAGLLLGRNAHQGRSVEVRLTPDQRSRHMYVVGASGTGKSTLLLNCILQDLEAGQGVAVLDPHGDLVDQVIERMPEKRIEDVILFDPADAEYPVGFNILSAHSELERTLLSSDLVAAFQRLATSWGDQMTSVLGNAILAFLESERGGTLADLRRFLVERAFRDEVLRTVRDPDVVYYWEKEFPLLHGKPQAPILTRLDMFLRPKLIRHMVGQKEDRLDFAEVMNEGRVFLARLSQGAIGEENAYLLGTLLVSKLQQTAMSRQELAEAERRPFYLYVDEFQNFVTPTMAQILSGARKYRLGLILAHQDLRQISKNPDVLSSVLSNPYTRICFRVGDHDARTLAEGFASFDSRDLQNLGIGQAICRVERSDFDFTLDTSPLAPMDPDRGREVTERITTLSREKYSRPREEVEAALRETQTVGPISPPPIVMASRTSPDTVALPSPPAPPEPKAPGREQREVPAPPRGDPQSAGRGGQQHRYLQELIRRWAESRDWRATVEEGVLDGLGSVDVALRKGEHALACEIAVTSPPEHEVENIQKCLAAGFERVISVAPDRKALAKIRDLADEAITKADLTRVRFCSPEETFLVIEEYESEIAGSSKTVRGYKVQVQYKKVGEADRAAKRQVVSKVVAGALGRLKKQDQSDF